MADDYEVRTIPSGTDDGTTTHRVAVVRIDDIARGFSNVRTQHFVQTGDALQWMQATTVTGGGVTTAGFYPNDATSISAAGAACAAGGSNQITLAAGSPDWDISGWSLHITSGSALGDVRRIKSYNTSTKVAVVDRNWKATVATSDTYTIGLDTFRRSWLVVKAECEGNSTQSPSISVIPAFFDYPRTPPTSGADQGRLGLDGSARTARVGFGVQLDMQNYNVQANTETASYYQMQIRSDQCLGASLAKIYLLTPPGSSKHCTLYLAAV